MMRQANCKQTEYSFVAIMSREHRSTEEVNFLLVSLLHLTTKQHSCRCNEYLLELRAPLIQDMFPAHFPQSLANTEKYEQRNHISPKYA